jgi:hypothetical protein
LPEERRVFLIRLKNLPGDKFHNAFTIQFLVMGLVAVAFETIVTSSLTGTRFADQLCGVNDPFPIIETLFNKASTARGLIVQNYLGASLVTLVCQPSPRDADVRRF